MPYNFNVFTGKLDYYSEGGSGDVVGPASATDNAVVRYDTTTGKLIQDSGVIIDDSNNITGVGDITASGTLIVQSGARSDTSIRGAAMGANDGILFGSGAIYQAVDAKIAMATTSIGVIVNYDSYYRMDFRVQSETNDYAFHVDADGETAAFGGAGVFADAVLGIDLDNNQVTVGNDLVVKDRLWINNDSDFHAFFEGNGARDYLYLGIGNSLDYEFVIGRTQDYNEVISNSTRGATTPIIRVVSEDIGNDEDDWIGMWSDSANDEGVIEVGSGKGLRLNSDYTYLDGGIFRKTTRVTTTYTILTTDNIVLCNTDAGAYTVTLPAGIQGQTYKIINSGTSSNNLTLAPNGSDNLLGENSGFVLADKESLYLTYDDTDGWD